MCTPGRPFLILPEQVPEVQTTSVPQVGQPPLARIDPGVQNTSVPQVGQPLLDRIDSSRPEYKRTSGTSAPFCQNKFQQTRLYKWTPDRPITTCNPLSLQSPETGILHSRSCVAKTSFGYIPGIEQAKGFFYQLFKTVLQCLTFLQSMVLLINVKL